MWVAAAAASRRVTTSSHHQKMLGSKKERRRKRKKEGKDWSMGREERKSEGEEVRREEDIEMDGWISNIIEQLEGYTWVKERKKERKNRHKGWMKAIVASVYCNRYIYYIPKETQSFSA